MKINIIEEGRINWDNCPWGSIIDQVKTKLHDSNSDTIFFGENEYLFRRLISQPKHKFHQTIREKILNCKQAIGISHQYRECLEVTNFHKTLEQNIQFFKKFKIMITLSEHMKSFWKKELFHLNPDLQVFNLYLPYPERENKFNMQSFKKNSCIRALGKFGRVFDIWNDLNTPYNKLPSSKDIILPWEDFDFLFTHTVQFIDLEGASAITGLLECMRRNTPLLIREHPAVKEYLGNEYPFYFESKEEAQAKVNNPKLIQVTHDYLRSMNKEFIDINYFITSLSNIIKAYT
jgi:hypothetical protein